MPGTAAGTVCCNTRTVARAISAGVACGDADSPERTMFGFNNVPSNMTLWSLNALYCAANTRSVTSALFSMLWTPSINTSGSTIGTKPLAWRAHGQRSLASATNRTNDMQAFVPGKWTHSAPTPPRSG
jgi:hypothetical protein